MNNTSKKNIETLNHLLSLHVDAKKGYIEIAENLDFPILIKWVLDYVRKREIFITDLSLQVVTLGGEPIKESSMIGNLHRFWIDLKSFLTSNDTVSLLDEAIRGERKIEKDYKEAITNDEITEELQNILKAHLDYIQIVLSDLEELKEIAKKQILFDE